MEDLDYNVLPIDGVTKMPKHVTVIIYTMKVLLCSMEDSKNISLYAKAQTDEFYLVRGSLRKNRRDSRQNQKCLKS